FATTFNLPIKEVVTGGDLSKAPQLADDKHINSDFLNGMYQEEAIQKAIQWLEEHKKGEKKETYRVRDRLVSRQRDWGEAIPIIHWEDGSMATVPVTEVA